MMKGLGVLNPKLIHKLRTVFTYVGETKQQRRELFGSKDLCHLQGLSNTSVNKGTTKTWEDYRS